MRHNVPVFYFGLWITTDSFLHIICFVARKIRHKSLLMRLCIFAYMQNVKWNHGPVKFVRSSVHLFTCSSLYSSAYLFSSTSETDLKQIWENGSLWPEKQAILISSQNTPSSFGYRQNWFYHSSASGPTPALAFLFFLTTKFLLFVKAPAKTMMHICPSAHRHLFDMVQIKKLTPMAKISTSFDWKGDCQRFYSTRIMKTTKIWHGILHFHLIKNTVIALNILVLLLVLQKHYLVANLESSFRITGEYGLGSVWRIKILIQFNLKMVYNSTWSDPKNTLACKKSIWHTYSKASTFQILIVQKWCWIWTNWNKRWEVEHMEKKASVTVIIVFIHDMKLIEAWNAEWHIRRQCR